MGVRHASPGDDILMVSRSGQAIRFSEKAARPMGRATAGVQGMRLRKDDEVIAISVAQDDDDLLVVTEQGYGKRTPVRDYPRKGRGGLGVKTIQLTDAKGKLAGSRVVRDGYQVMLISTGGTMIKKGRVARVVEAPRPGDTGRDRRSAEGGRDRLEPGPCRRARRRSRSCRRVGLFALHKREPG